MKNNNKTNKSPEFPLKDKKDHRKSDYSNDIIETELSILNDALDSTLNGVIITDINGEIKFANKAFVKMFDYMTKDDVTGKYAADIFATQKIKTFTDIEISINSSEGDTREFHVYSEDGTIFPVEVSTSIVTDKNNNIIGKMASFIDITERKQAEEENRRLYSELMKSQEKERQRLAVDLHDGVGQTLLAAKLNFIAFQQNPEKHKDRFKIGIQFIDKVSQELREVCNDLYPSILRDMGLEKTIQWYTKNYLELYNIITRLNIKLDNKLPHELEVNLYRIVKEIISNIFKHSKADTVAINLEQRDSCIFLMIRDNGIGFSPAQVKGVPSGYGIANIQQRIKEMGASMEIESSPGMGTEINISIDILQEQDNEED